MPKLGEKSSPFLPSLLAKPSSILEDNILTKLSPTASNPHPVLAAPYANYNNSTTSTIIGGNKSLRDLQREASLRAKLA